MNKFVCGFDGNGKFLSGCVYKDEGSLTRPKMLNRAVVLTEVVEQEVFDLYRQGYYRNADGVPTKPEAPELTQEEIQAQLTGVVQHVLDAKAQELNYDNCLSVCSYIDTGVAKFDAEGKAFRAWRSQVWAKGYEILAQVQSGEREIPTEEELIAELPELVIEYEVK